MFGWGFWRLEERCAGRKEKWKAMWSLPLSQVCTMHKPLGPNPSMMSLSRVWGSCLSGFTHSLQPNPEIHQSLSILAKQKQGACTKLHFFLGGSLISKIWLLWDSGKYSMFRHMLQTIHQKANYNTTLHLAISLPTVIPKNYHSW